MYKILKQHTKANGEVKYYASYQTAWNAASRLNETDSDNGIWIFEQDMTGWFVFQVLHGSENN
jgi:hypothetical protein